MDQRKELLITRQARLRASRGPSRWRAPAGPRPRSSSARCQWSDCLFWDLVGSEHRCAGNAVRDNRCTQGDPSVAGDLGGDVPDPPDVEVTMRTGEAQPRGEHAAHDVAVEQGHRSVRCMRQRRVQLPGDGQLPDPDRPVNSTVSPGPGRTRPRAATPEPPVCRPAAWAPARLERPDAR